VKPDNDMIKPKPLLNQILLKRFHQTITTKCCSIIKYENLKNDGLQELLKIIASMDKGKARLSML
jgi:hypothetical protein